MSWQRNRFFRQVRARPRLFLAIVVAVTVGLLMPTSLASPRYIV